MLNHSYKIILSGLMSMGVGSILVYIKMLDYLAYALLGYGFIAIGIGILLGFIKMVREDEG
jgi:hypothetical protein